MPSNVMVSLGALLPTAVQQHLGLYLALLIVALGLIIGLGDILRLSIKRIWAISGVCFDESIRRRVLWITPLAILGIIIVSQLQRPLDEQDAIRQTIKICLFTTGLVVVISTIILACTNLPREIENRVIYTVVTKPTTRLEIVLGKIAGFARVALTILVIMGIFSYGYLLVRSWRMQRYISDRLDAPGLPSSEKQTLVHYQQTGLLNARTLEQPDDLEVFAKAPAPNATTWTFAGDGEGMFDVPFHLSQEQVNAETSQGGASVQVLVGYHRKTTEPAPEQKAKQPTTGPAPYYGPYVIPPEERQEIMKRVKPQANPTIAIEILDQNMNSLGTATNPLTNRPLEIPTKDELDQVRAYIPPNVFASMAGKPSYVRVIGSSANTEYFTGKAPVSLIMPGPQGELITLTPVSERPIFESRSGTFGQQLRGMANSQGPIGVYAYRDARLRGSNPNVTFEAKFGIERSGSDLDPMDMEEDVPTQLVINVRNLRDGKSSGPIVIHPESNRSTFFEVPTDAVAGGNFDVLMQCRTPGHFVGLQNASLLLITSRQPFVLNLALSLFILWLMSILVTAVAIFASTFLSWPIAVVLTLLILLGHWGVEELGDATAPGIGNQIVTDLGLKGSAPAKAVSATVEQLSGLLNFSSTILPDISQFAAVEDIERGVTVSAQRLGDAAAVVLGFGIPLTVLAYIILKNKEVAP